MIALALAAVLVASDPADAAPPKVADRAPFRAPRGALIEPAAKDAAPDALAALLRERCSRSIEARLKAVDEDELLAGFEHRPGEQAWIGEHAGKWMHAAALAWAATGDPALAAKIERVRDRLIATQEKDGYLGTYATDRRFGLHDGADWDVWVHKYDLIGLLEWHRWSRDAKSLAACRRIGDLLCATFAERDLASAGTHMGMAATSVLEPMVLLYRATGEPRYLAFCERLVERMSADGGPDLLRALVAGTPVCRVANAKAYEMLSNLVGFCELYRQTGRRELLDAVTHASDDVALHRLYPTGSGSAGEHWRPDGDFPCGESDGCCETCVTVTWIQLESQLYALTGERKHLANVANAVFNHLLAAQHPAGADWCYFTPLEGRRHFDSATTCCHSSGPRALALVPRLGIDALAACARELGSGPIDGAAFGRPGRFALRRDGLVLAAAAGRGSILARSSDGAFDERTLAPFALAGADGSAVTIWLRDAATLPPPSLSAGAAESASRAGNVDGSIADGDPQTFRVTFDGHAADLDVFAVAFAKPTAVHRAVFRHGHCFHDGGWFDASALRPRIEVKTREDGAWQPVGELADYPKTTATDARALADGQAFTLDFPATTIVALRVVGRGASGDSPAQCFASCAELEAW